MSEGTDSLLFVLVDEDSEQDAVHRGAVLESAHGAGSSPDLAEPALDSVGGSDLPALIGVLVAETGQQIVEIVAQACDGSGVCTFPALALGGAPGLGAIVGVHDSVEIMPDGVLIDLAYLVEDVSDLVRPVALDRDAVVGGGQGRQQALAAVDADHLQTFAGQPRA